MKTRSRWLPFSSFLQLLFCIAWSQTQTFTITTPRTTDINCWADADECLIDCQVDNGCSNLHIYCPYEEDFCDACRVNCTGVNSCNNITIYFANCDVAEVNTFSNYSLNSSIIHAPLNYFGPEFTTFKRRRRGLKLTTDHNYNYNTKIYNGDYNNPKQTQKQIETKQSLTTRKRRLFTLPDNAKYLYINVLGDYDGGGNSTSTLDSVFDDYFSIYDTIIIGNQSTNSVVQINGQNSGSVIKSLDISVYHESVIEFYNINQTAIFDCNVSLYQESRMFINNKNESVMIGNTFSLFDNSSLIVDMEDNSQFVENHVILEGSGSTLEVNKYFSGSSKFENNEINGTNGRKIGIKSLDDGYFQSNDIQCPMNSSLEFKVDVTSSNISDGNVFDYSVTQSMFYDKWSMYKNHSCFVVLGQDTKSGNNNYYVGEGLPFVKYSIDTHNITLAKFVMWSGGLFLFWF